MLAHAAAPAPPAEARVEATARRSRSSFYYAFLFLPRAQREALDAVYSFCRLVDDAVDEAPSPAAARANLAWWRAAVEEVFAEGTIERDDVVLALRRAVRAFPIRRADLDAVIEGCDWDADRARYATWDELRAYCERVASAVGLMCIEVFGYRDPNARRYAVDLGLALQLTNILRDVDEDAGRGRIYLPLEDLARFAVDEDDLLAGRRTPRVQQLLRFEAERAESLYRSARAAIPKAERDRLVVAEMMGDIYHALLVELRRRDFPSERASINPARKLALALRRYLAARLG